MTGVWMYPWQLSDRDGDSPVEPLRTVGVDHLKIAAHYHSVQTFDPKRDPPDFDVFSGGCLFDPDAAQQRVSAIDLPTPDRDTHRGSFDRAVTAATEQGFDVDAWVVCLHGTRLGEENPAYQIQDAFGTSHAHALCPSHPEVRQYFGSIVDALSAYDIDQIDLESVGFPSVIHGHGASFGHHKDHAVDSRALEFLLSQCFCEGCQRMAGDDIDLAAAEETVQTLCRQYFDQPTASVPDLATLEERSPELQALFEFRESVIDSFLSQLAAACDGPRLAYYLADGGGYTPTELWPSGVTADVLAEHVDRLTVLCYAADDRENTRRLEETTAACSHEVEAGLTVDPAVVDGRDHWDRLSDEVSETVSGDVFVYNYTAMTDRHLKWLEPLGVSREVP